MWWIRSAQLGARYQQDSILLTAHVQETILLVAINEPVVSHWKVCMMLSHGVWYQTSTGRVQGGSKCMLTPLITMSASEWFVSWQQLYVTGIALGVAKLHGTWYLVPLRCWSKSCWSSRLSTACFKMRPKLSNLQYILTGTMVPRYRGTDEQAPLC